MVVATKRGFDWAAAVQRGARIRVATKYVQTAREHFAAKGMHVDLIKLYGSMELAPLVGLADVDRRPRVERQHAQGQRSRRRRGHHADQRAPHRQSGCAQAEARCGAAVARCDGGRRGGAAEAMSAPLDVAAARRGRAGVRARARSADRVRGRAGPDGRRGGGAIVADVRARGDAALLEYTAQFDRLARRVGRRAGDRGGRDARRPSRRCRGASARRSKPRRRAFARYHERQKMASWSLPRGGRQRARRAGDAARSRRRLRAGRQGGVSVVGADERRSRRASRASPRS